MNYRNCGSDLRLPVVDLSSMQSSNVYLSLEVPSAPGFWLSQCVLMSGQCWLVYHERYVTAVPVPQFLPLPQAQEARP